MIMSAATDLRFSLPFIRYRRCRRFCSTSSSTCSFASCASPSSSSSHKHRQTEYENLKASSGVVLSRDMDTLRYQVSSCTNIPGTPLSPTSTVRTKKMYKQPDSPFVALLWRMYLWLSVTFALSVMEPWEKVLVVVVVSTILGFICLGMLRYVPQFVTMSIERTRYYMAG